jgi:transposase
MSQRQRFAKEFKLEAVQLLKQSGRPAAAIARELGIPRNRLYKWAADLDTNGAGAFPGSGRAVGTEDEVVRLRRENARLKEERDILKKAAAYFAKDLP